MTTHPAKTLKPRDYQLYVTYQASVPTNGQTWVYG